MNCMPNGVKNMPKYGMDVDFISPWDIEQKKCL